MVKDKNLPERNNHTIGKSVSASAPKGSNSLPLNADRREEPRVSVPEASAQLLDHTESTKFTSLIQGTATLKDTVAIPATVPDDDFPQLMSPIYPSQRPLQTIYIDILRIDY